MLHTPVFLIYEGEIYQMLCACMYACACTYPYMAYSSGCASLLHRARCVPPNLSQVRIPRSKCTVPRENRALAPRLRGPSTSLTSSNGSLKNMQLSERWRNAPFWFSHPCNLRKSTENCDVFLHAVPDMGTHVLRTTEALAKPFAQAAKRPAQSTPGIYLDSNPGSGYWKEPSLSSFLVGTPKYLACYTNRPGVHCWISPSYT